MINKKIEDYEKRAIEWLKRNGNGWRQEEEIQVINVLVNIDLVNSLFRGTYIKPKK